MSVPTIYYLRHGQTDWNAAGRFQGSQDIPLNAIGRGQASYVGGVLKNLIADTATDLSFVSSPLGRARTTMELVRSALDLPHHDYALDARLREIGFGSWEGFTVVQQAADDPAHFAAREANRWHLPAPGGESYAEATQRVSDWLSALSGDTVAVSHGGTARALMVALGIETPDSASEVFIEQGVVYMFNADGLTKVR